MKTETALSVGLTVGTRKFSRSASALVDSLFDPSGTSDGIYRKRKHSTLFMRPNGEPFACLVANPGQSRFFVSAFRQSDGRTRYSYGLTDADRDSLGLHGMGYGQQSDEAARVWSVLNS